MYIRVLSVSFFGPSGRPVLGGVADVFFCDRFAGCVGFGVVGFGGDRLGASVGECDGGGFDGVGGGGGRR